MEKINFTKKFICYPFLIVLLCSLLFAADAKVNSVSGKVEKQDGDNWVAVSVGDVIEAGTIISTGFKSTASLMIGLSQIEVKPLTRLTVEQLTEKNGEYSTSMYLDAGGIKADIKKAENKRVGFKVKTPVATASVRGTSGEVFSSGLVIGTSGTWVLTPPEKKNIVKPEKKLLSLDNEEAQTSEDNSNEEGKSEEGDAEEAAPEEVASEEKGSEEAPEEPLALDLPAEETGDDSQPAEETAPDAAFYEALDQKGVTVSANQIASVDISGSITPPQTTAATNSTSTGGITKLSDSEKTEAPVITSTIAVENTISEPVKPKTTGTIIINIPSFYE